jgi:hypothetical protein
VGSLLCNAGTDPLAWWLHTADWLWRGALAFWPAIAVAAMGAAAAGVVLGGLLRRARYRAAAEASWVAITPPAVMPAGGAQMLWRALAGLMLRTRRHGLAPCHLVMEFVADEAGMRVGIWVPPSVSAAAVAQVIVGCWPGARAAVMQPPLPVWKHAGMPAAAGMVGAVCVRPGGGVWAPLIDPSRSARASAGQVDPLHAVLAALAERRGGERACAQLVVSPTGHTGRAFRGDLWWAPIVRALVRAPFLVLFWVFDLLTSPHNSHSRSPGPPPRTAHPASATEDPATAAYRKAVAVKKSRGPHLSVTLRVSLSSAGPQVSRRRELTAIVNGYDLAAPEARLRTGRLRGPVDALVTRGAGRRRDRFMVTLAEAAALWHLPDQPSLYGITDASARIRRPIRDLPRFIPNPRQRPLQPQPSPATPRHQPGTRTSSDERGAE